MLSFSSMLEAQEAREGRGQRAAFTDENADGLGDGMARMHRRGGRMAGEVRESVLTAEQQSALKVLVGELKAGEATQEEIHTAVAGQFADWGIELPEKPEGIARSGRGERGNSLTEEQQATIGALVSDLRANNATPEEIRAAIAGQLADLGVELPERPAGKGEHARFGKGGRAEGAEGTSEATVRRGAARRMDSKNIETMMLQTQGRSAR